MSNNPPEVSLELTTDQAEFLLKNCTTNMSLGLGFMMQIKDRKTIEKLIEQNEKFKEIREKLLAQGVKEDE